MFTAALFIIAKTWKQTTCPLTDGWIKMRYRYTMGYYSARRKNKEILPAAITGIDLEMIILSEVSQRQKSNDTGYIWNLKKEKYTNQLICKTEIDPQHRKQIYSYLRRKGIGELGVWDYQIHTTTYKIDN